MGVGGGPVVEDSEAETHGDQLCPIPWFCQL